MNYPDNIAADRTRFTDYSFVRPRLFLRLINPKTNPKVILDSPFKPFLDLVIVYHILIENTDESVCSVRIDNTLFEAYDITLEDLHEDALKSSLKLFPASIFPIIPPDEQSATENTIFCVTNKDGIFGSSSIVYPDVLSRLSRKLRSNLYIIPSSTDECIVVSVREEISPEKMKSILHEVNDTMLRPEQYLNNHLYYYDRKSDQVMAML